MDRLLEKMFIILTLKESLFIACFNRCKLHIAYILLKYGYEYMEQTSIESYFIGLPNKISQHAAHSFSDRLN